MGLLACAGAFSPSRGVLPRSVSSFHMSQDIFYPFFDVEVVSTAGLLPEAKESRNDEANVNAFGQGHVAALVPLASLLVTLQAAHAKDGEIGIFEGRHQSAAQQQHSTPLTHRHVLPRPPPPPNPPPPEQVASPLWCTQPPWQPPSSHPCTPRSKGPQRQAPAHWKVILSEYANEYNGHSENTLTYNSYSRTHSLALMNHHPAPTTCC